MAFSEKLKTFMVRHLSIKWLKNIGYTDKNWCKDPLSHPDLELMSERELADLPFDPAHIDSE